MSGYDTAELASSERQRGFDRNVALGVAVAKKAVSLVESKLRKRPPCNCAASRATPQRAKRPIKYSFRADVQT